MMAMDTEVTRHGQKLPKSMVLGAWKTLVSVFFLRSVCLSLYFYFYFSSFAGNSTGMGIWRPSGWNLGYIYISAV